MHVMERGRDCYARSGWTRYEFHGPPMHGKASPPVIVLVEGGTVTEVKRTDSPLPEISIGEHPWQNHNSHPLMLYYELNPLIYESVEYGVLSSQDAAEAGAEDAVGHRIAVLRTSWFDISPTAQQKQRMETWLDLDTGRVISSSKYAKSGSLVMRRRDYRYRQVGEGVTCLVGRITVFPAAATIEETVEDVQLNVPVDKTTAFLFTPNV